MLNEKSKHFPDVKFRNSFYRTTVCKYKHMLKHMSQTTTCTPNVKYLLPVLSTAWLTSALTGTFRLMNFNQGIVTLQVYFSCQLC